MFIHQQHPYVFLICNLQGDKPPAPDGATENKEEADAHLNDLTTAVIGDTGKGWSGLNGWRAEAEWLNVVANFELFFATWWY